MTDDPRWTWLWDLRPLADGAWGNIQYPMAMFADWGSEPGSVIAVRRWVTGPSGAAFLTEYTPADDYVTEGYDGRHPTYNGLYQDEDRRYYVPHPEDLARVQSIFPNLPDPANPSWPQVEAELIAADRSPDELQRMTAPALIRLLTKSHDLANPSNAPTPAVIADQIESLPAEADDGSTAKPNTDGSQQQQAAGVTWQELNPAQQAIVQVLWSMKPPAINENSHPSQREIVAAAFGPDAVAATYKGMFAGMVELGILKSKRGSAGGYWLTACGCDMAKANLPR